MCQWKNIEHRSAFYLSYNTKSARVFLYLTCMYIREHSPGPSGHYSTGTSVCWNSQCPATRPTASELLINYDFLRLRTDYLKYSRVHRNQVNVLADFFPHTILMILSTAARLGTGCADTVYLMVRERTLSISTPCRQDLKSMQPPWTHSKTPLCAALGMPFEI